MLHLINLLHKDNRFYKNNFLFIDNNNQDNFLDAESKNRLRK